MATLFGMLRRIGDLGDMADGVGALMPTVPAGRNYYAEIEPSSCGQPTAEAGLAGEAFVPGHCYFSVRLVEMRLADSGNYIAAFVPLCALFLRYNEAGAKREIPYVAGSDLIEKAMGAAVPQSGARKVGFRDIYVARNVPCNSDGLEMFAALCRFNDSSLSRGILDFVATAIGIFAGPAGGAIVKAGESLITPLARLFGAEGVHIRFGIFDGKALRRSGYRVLAGADSQDRLQGLQLVDGVLHRPRRDGAMEPVDDVDYLVLAFEQRTTLGADIFNAATALPFHRKWTDVTTALVAGNDIAAKAAFQSLAVDVAGSPLLTEKDRFALLAAYTNERKKWRQTADSLKSGAAANAYQGVAAAVADRREAASRRGSAAAGPLEAAGVLLSRPVRKRASDPGKPDDATLAQAFSSLVESLGTDRKKGGGRQGAAGAPAADDYSEASRELLSVVLADRD